MSGLIAAGITAAAGLGSAAINAAAQKRANATNREMSDEAYRRQVEAIKQQNIYNSPAMQVARMKAAGLNPSLAYGADGAMVGEQSDIPAYQPIPNEALNVGSLGTVAAQSVQAGLDVREQENRNNLAVAEIAVKDAQTFAYLMQGNLNDAQVTEVLTLLGYKADKLASEVNLNEAEISRIVKLNELSDKEMQEIESRIGLNSQQIETLASQYNLNKAQAYRILQMLPHEIAVADSQTAFNYVQSEVGREQIRKIGADISAMRFYQGLDESRFNFDKHKFAVDDNYRRETFVANAKMWQKEYFKDVGLHTMDDIGRITGFIVGARAIGDGSK